MAWDMTHVHIKQPRAKYMWLGIMTVEVIKYCTI